MGRRSRERFKRAHETLSVLAERCPLHPLPHAYLAHWYAMLPNQGWSEDAKREAQLATDHVAHAIDADPNCSVAHAVNGWVYTHLINRLDLAMECQERALELNPNDALAWCGKGAVLTFTLGDEQGWAAAQKALRLSPLDPRRSYYQTIAATAAANAGLYERSIELAKAALRVDRFHTSTYRALAVAQYLAGRTTEARETVSSLMQIHPELTVSNYLKRHPSGAYSVGQRWARILRAAGVPE